MLLLNFVYAIIMFTKNIWHYSNFLVKFILAENISEIAMLMVYKSFVLV